MAVLDPFKTSTFSATGANEDAQSDTLYVDGTTISGYTGIPPTCRAVYVGGAGDLKVDMADGSTVTLEGVLAGSILPIQVSKIYATGTSATNIHALF